MRMMIQAEIPVTTGNEYIKNGKLGSIVESLVTDIKPECAYFFANNGRRAMFFVVNMTDASQLATICERLFLGLDANVEITPVMVAEDLKKASATFDDIAKKYAR